MVVAGDGDAAVVGIVHARGEVRPPGARVAEAVREGRPASSSARCARDAFVRRCHTAPRHRRRTLKHVLTPPISAKMDSAEDSRRRAFPLARQIERRWFLRARERTRARYANRDQVPWIALPLCPASPD